MSPESAAFLRELAATMKAEAEEELERDGRPDRDRDAGAAVLDQLAA